MPVVYVRISVNVGLGVQGQVQFASRFALNDLTVGILIGRFFHKGNNGMLFVRWRCRVQNHCWWNEYTSPRSPRRCLDGGLCGELLKTRGDLWLGNYISAETLMCKMRIDETVGELLYAEHAYFYTMKTNWLWL